MLTASPCPSPRCPRCLPSCPHSRLLALTCVIMPRGRKSKRRAREKRHQARGETQSLKGAQATEAAAAAEEMEEPPPSPASVSRGTPPSSPVAGTRQEPPGAPATSPRDAGVSCPGSEEGAQSQGEESESHTSGPAPSWTVRLSLPYVDTGGCSMPRDPPSRGQGPLLGFQPYQDQARQNRQHRLTQAHQDLQGDSRYPRVHYASLVIT